MTRGEATIFQNYFINSLLQGLIDNKNDKDLHISCELTAKCNKARAGSSEINARVSFGLLCPWKRHFPLLGCPGLRKKCSMPALLNR